MTASATSPMPQRPARALIAWAVLAMILLAFCGLGNIAAYIAMIAALLVIFVRPRASEWRAAVMTPANLALIAAFAALALGCIVNAFDDDRLSALALFLPLLWGVPAALLFAAIGGRERIVLLGQMALAGSAVSLIVVVLEPMVMHSSRPSGLELSPIHYATISQIVGFLALCVPLQRKRPLDVIYLAGPVFGLAAALLTGTRASVITFAVLALAASIFAIYRFKPKAWMMALVIAALVAGTVILAWLFRDTSIGRALSGGDAILRTMQGNLASDTSTAYRLEMYTSALRAVLDAPLFGHGWHNQLAVALPYMSEFGREGYALEGWGYIHNDALSFLISGGLFGLIAYVLIFAAPVLAVVYSPRDSQFFARAYALATIALGIFAAGLTDAVFMVEVPKVMLAVLSIGVPLMCTDRPAGASEKDSSAP